MLFCSSSTCRVIAFHRIERSCFICSSNTQQYFINMYERGNKTNVCMCMWNDHDCSCGLRLYWENGEERETMRDEKWWFCMYVRMYESVWMNVLEVKRMRRADDRIMRTKKAETGSAVLLFDVRLCSCHCPAVKKRAVLHFHRIFNRYCCNS